MTITEFLLARIAEDEAAANAAYNKTRLTWGSTAEAAASAAGPDAGLFILFNGPNRALRECDAKRRAIDAAWADHQQIEGEWGSCQSRAQMDAKDDVPEVVSALAAVYADHPDYRSDWAP